MLFFSLLLASISFAATEPRLNDLNVPPGFSLSLYARAESARSLAVGENGLLFVGSLEGKVYALLPDANGDGKSDGVRVVAQGLNEPVGVAARGSDLFIGEIDKIGVIRDVAKKLSKPSKPEAWGPAFPKDTHHGRKHIAFGPDGWLYVPQGAPCNVCDRDSNLYATILRVSPDGKKRELVAKGVRNSVGFDWHPDTKEFWFTDNGRDHMGDEIPPDELNRLEKMGDHFGFPHCHAGLYLDPEFGNGKNCDSYKKPSALIPAHSAALGMRFLRHQKDASLNGSVLVAEHGSWNRSSPIGYQVARVKFSAKGGRGERMPFLTGFLQKGKSWGRPVDIAETADGSIYISDDQSGSIYRLQHKP